MEKREKERRIVKQKENFQHEAKRNQAPKRCLISWILPIEHRPFTMTVWTNACERPKPNQQVPFFHAIFELTLFFLTYSCQPLDTFAFFLVEQETFLFALSYGLVINCKMLFVVTSFGLMM